MTGDAQRRKPQAFSVDDPDLVERQLDVGEAAAEARRAEAVAPEAGEPAEGRLASREARRRGFRWGAILLTALSALGGIALTLSFARFVAIALERQDWIGWSAFALLSVAAIAFAAIVLREVVGMLRLGRLGRLKRDLEAALAKGDIDAERRALEAVLGNVSGRTELKWPLAALAEHARGVNDPGDLARIADRDVMPTLDGDARRLVAATAKRVSVVSALSPMMLLTVGWILVENLRLLRSLATLYGGRPGFLGSMRLARMVFTHIVATGGVAMTDDLFGQFLGQDLVRRLSRRLGESVFNAALTARIGAAAIEVIRPLPYLATPKIRARDFVAEVVRMVRGSEPAPATGRKRDGSGEA
jgi:putative membrane protein